MSLCLFACSSTYSAKELETCWVGTRTKSKDSFASFWAQLPSSEPEGKCLRILGHLMVRNVYVMLLSWHTAPNPLLSSLCYRKQKREAVPRWSYRRLQEERYGQIKCWYFKPNAKVASWLRLAYKIWGWVPSYCNILVFVAISCLHLPKGFLLSGLLGIFSLQHCNKTM